LGVTFAIAFASLIPQIKGLWGNDGILPASRLLQVAGDVLPGASRWLSLPSVFWWGSSDDVMLATAALGVVVSVVLIAGFVPRACLALLWALYLSFVSVGGVFLGFQWDTLLLETAAVGFFFAPWGLRLVPGRGSAVGRLGLWILAFKLMWMSGVVKLASGDPTWRNLSALRFHFWTQPLPNAVGLFVARWPHLLLKGMTLGALLIELVLPFAILFGPRGRRAAFLGFAGLQAAIALTGSYGFFNLLAVVLALPLLDEVTPRLWGRPWAVRAGALGLAALVALPMITALVPSVERARPLRAVTRALSPFDTFNGYGLFAVMTTKRPTVLLEGSADGRTWVPYQTRFQAGPGERPVQVAPYQPRLDWQLWFAALGRCQDNPWFLALANRLLQKSAPVQGLFARVPPKPPRFLRSTVVDLVPAEGGRWRGVTSPQPYCPVLTREDGRLVAVPEGS
jgi:hypothetical protein